VFSYRKGTYRAGIFDGILRLTSRDRQPNEIVASPLLHREIDGVAVGGPLCRALAIVDRRTDFPAVAAVGVHDPDVGVLHGGLAVGEAAAGATKEDALAIGRPEWIVFDEFAGGDAADGVVRQFQRENVIVKEFVLVRLRIREIEKL